MVLMMHASNDIRRFGPIKSRRRSPKPKPRRPKPSFCPRSRGIRPAKLVSFRPPIPCSPPAKPIHHPIIPKVENVELPQVVNVEIPSAESSTSPNPRVERGVEVEGPLIDKGKAPLENQNNASSSREKDGHVFPSFASWCKKYEKSREDNEFPPWCKKYEKSSSSPEKDDDDINKDKAPLKVQTHVYDGSWCKKCAPSSSFYVFIEDKRQIAYYRSLYPYKCDLCMERFKEEDALKLHRRTHLDPPSHARKPVSKPVTRPLFPLGPVPPAPSPLIDHELNLNLTLAPALDLELTLAPAVPSAEAMPMTGMAYVDLGLAVGNSYVDRRPEAWRAKQVGPTKVEWFKLIEGMMFNVARDGATNPKPLSDEELELKF